MSTEATVEMTETNARSFMSSYLIAYLDDSATVDATDLAEACASFFYQDGPGGPLENPDHALWTWAADVADEYQRMGWSS